MDELDLGHTIRSFTAGQILFGRYTLEKVLGRGGMGVVWLAHDQELDRAVALKFLPEQMAQDEQAVADLKRETKKTQQLRHHHIVAVYDFRSDGETACIAMEYVDGPTLAALKARKEKNCLEIDELKPWIGQLCEALSYAHEKAMVVHRDLKPANLMVNSKSELKVADFGIARSLSDSISMLTMTHGTSGTLVYMSPQQLNGERPSHLDDVYSLGATIYELTTGKPPFYGIGDLTYQIKNKVPERMTPRRREFNVGGPPVPEEWEKTVADCLAKNPEQRPQSAAEVAERLGVARVGTRRNTSEKTKKKPALGSAKPKTGVLIGLGLLGLAVVVGAVGFWGFYPPAQSRKEHQNAQQVQRNSPEPTASKRETERPAPIAQGAVLIQTEPAGAIVTLASQSRKSPATFNHLEVGSWPVKVERDGYETVEQSVTVEANNIGEPPAIKLIRSTGKARIESDPAGIKFDLVDADAEHHPGHTPADLENIPIGIGRVMFTPEGGTEHWQEIKIQRNQTVKATWRAETVASSLPQAEAIQRAQPTQPPSPAITPVIEKTFKNSLGRNMAWIAALRIWVCETEVTQGEFATLMGHNPSQNLGSDELPVDSVTVSEANEFCARLTNREAATLPARYAYMLPTDSQWTVFCANASLEDSVTSQTSVKSGPSRIKSLGSNEFGLYDTRGNVWEWTKTPYDSSLNSADIRAKYTFGIVQNGPRKGSVKGLDPKGLVLRGGSWRSKGDLLEKSTRGSNSPGTRDNTNGFRVVLAPRE
ncbi:MAG: eukaryotic-like serine/threonine-protein kinase [Verrucomicrobiota bacterium]|jgi:serine/threonine protein kinase